MQKLTISPDLSLPLEFVTQTQAILAKRGVGKSYTASVEAEEMLQAGQQVVVIDPTGAWWGLKSSADGKSAAFSIAIFGGEHADVPLEEGAGEAVAQAIVEGRFSAIIDLSLFRKGQMNRFMGAFLETLYRLNREAMHLIVDEADAVAPQKPFGDEARTLGAMEDVVRRGRKRGIGCTLITQRPAVLNKNVLTQCEILCALRLVHPKDIDAIEEWVNVHADPVQAKAMIDSLPSLPIGTAWFWAPGWGDLFKRVRIRQRHTFDSSATPKAGEKTQTAKVLASVDIKALGVQIQSAVQRAKENDPKELKKRIAELEREVAKKAVVTPAKVETVEVKVPVIESEQLDWVRDQAEKLQEAAAQIRKQIDEAVALCHPKRVADIAVKKNTPCENSDQPVNKSTPMSALANGVEELPEGERKILIVCAQYPEGADKVQISILTGYKRSTRDRYLQYLRQKGLIEEEKGLVAATGAGVNALGDSYEELPTGLELQRYWLGKLPEGERKILQLLIDVGGKAVRKDELDEPTGFKRSTRDRYLQYLASRKLVNSVNKGEVRASEVLFA